MQREASTYSLLRSLRTSVRTTLAMLAQLVSPMTSESVSTFAVPRMACSSTTSSRFGTLSRISVSRIRRRSSQSGAQPDRAEQNGDGCGQQRGQNADGQRNAPAVPDHGENIAAHRVRPEEKFPRRRFIAVRKVEIGRIVRQEHLAEQASEHDERQNSGRKKSACRGTTARGVPVLRATAAGRRPDESGRLSF